MVKQQAETGIDVVNDGEYGKSSWTGYVNERLLGFEARPATGGFALLQRSYDMRQYADYYNEAWSRGTLWHSSGNAPPSAAPMQYVCVEPLRYDAAAVQRDIENFKAALAGLSPPSGRGALDKRGVHAGGGAGQHRAGPRQRVLLSRRGFVFALAEALSQEYAAIVRPASSSRSTMPGSRRCGTDAARR